MAAHYGYTPLRQNGPNDPRSVVVAGARETPERELKIEPKAPNIDLTTSIAIDECIEDGKDVVQFTSPYLLFKEDEGMVAVDVLRIGELQKPCAVAFQTVAQSAIAGLNFNGTAGVLEFKPGEAVKSIQVEILDDGLYDTTLTFLMVLQEPENCSLDACLREIPVSILNRQRFPSDKLKHEIDTGDSEILLGVCWALMWDYFRFVFWSVPTIWWKSACVLILDQVRNVYYLCTIYLRVYLVDVILNVHDDSAEEHLIFPGSRSNSAIAVALAFCMPHLLIVGLDRYIAGSLELGFNIRKHHRVNLFRKYLHYTEESLLKIGVHDLARMLDSTIPTVVASAYLGVLSMVKDAGKIACVAWFMINKDHRNGIAFLLFPVAIYVWMCCRNSKQLHLTEQSSVGMTKSQDMLAQTAHAKQVVSDYRYSQSATAAYEDVLTGQRKITKEFQIFEFWNEQLVPFLTLLCIGLFMAFGAMSVLNGGMSVGTFLATINVYKDLGERFDGIYSKLDTYLNAVDPLIEMVTAFNLPIDLREKMVIQRERVEFTKEQAKLVLAQPGRNGRMDQKAWDSIPFRFTAITVEHIPSLQGFRAEVKQGSLVMLYGKHGYGKTHLLKLISDHSSSEGHVLFASHQACYTVGYEPGVLPWLNLFENLRFGCPVPHRDGSRLRRIFQSVSGMSDEHWMMQMLDSEIKAKNTNTEIEIKDAKWIKRLSHCERKFIHICRALIYGAQILVFHRTCDDLEIDAATRFLNMLGRYAHSVHDDRKRRTVFLSCGNRHMEHLIDDVADYHWDLEHSVYRELRQAQTSPTSQQAATAEQKGDPTTEQSGNRMFARSPAPTSRNLQAADPKARALEAAAALKAVAEPSSKASEADQRESRSCSSAATSNQQSREQSERKPEQRSERPMTYQMLSEHAQAKSTAQGAAQTGSKSLGGRPTSGHSNFDQPKDLRGRLNDALGSRPDGSGKHSSTELDEAMIMMEAVERLADKAVQQSAQNKYSQQSRQFERTAIRPNTLTGE